MDIDYDTIWRQQDEIRTVVNAVLGECIMTKTKYSVIVPLSREAKKWLPEPKGNDIPYFTLPVPATISLVLKNWMEKAGIDKRITFHCAKHLRFS